MIKPKAPCRTCKKRQVGCHASCKKFAEYEKKQSEYVRLVRENRLEANEVKIGKWYR